MFLSVLFAAALTFTSEDAELAHRLTGNFVAACTPRDAGTIRGSIAANWLLDTASSQGVDIRRDKFFADSPTGQRSFVNLYSEFKSDATSRWVVVISHFDTKPGVNCPGANDGASTACLLIALANMLTNARDRTGNVLLLWTDGEECISNYAPNDGLQGARRALERMQYEARPVQAVICLDMLGDRDLHVNLPSNVTPSLAQVAEDAARHIGETNLVSRIDRMVTDDHAPFLKAGMPAIDLIDFNYGPANAWWHTEEDTIDKVSQESLLKSGRLVTEILNILL